MVTLVDAVQNKLPILREVIQLFATQIKLVSQRVKELWCCTKIRIPHCNIRRGSINVSKVSFNPQLKEAEYVDPNHRFIM